MAGETVAKYQFASWARRGMSLNIQDNDQSGLARPKIHVSVAINATGNPTVVPVNLVAPRDIIGLNSDMIVRVYPPRSATNQDPGKLVLAEFYDEDFLWRYTPAAANGEQLSPWIVLIVLERSEFTFNTRTLPLPTLSIADTTTSLPPVKDTWLWAHMHITTPIPDDPLQDHINSLNTDAPTDPDNVYCRLLCPRRLEPSKSYTAFIVPAFEAGRLAGLGLLESSEAPPAPLTPLQKTSWDDDTPKALDMPVYYQWDFTTGINEDFESLIALLEPRVLPPQVGIRDMDCSAPGFARIDTTGDVVYSDGKPTPVNGTSPGTLGLEGALKTIDTVSTIYPDQVSATDFQQEVELLVNYATLANKNTHEDPIVSIPFYGQNYTLSPNGETALMDHTSNNWYNELNRDPRLRAAAAFGTKVVQANGDKFMRRAWEQVNTVLYANRLINSHKFTMAYSEKMFDKHFSDMPGEMLLSVTAALHGKIVTNGESVEQTKVGSTLPAAAFNPLFRKMMSVNGNIARKTGSVQVVDQSKIIASVTANTIAEAAPKKILPGLSVLGTALQATAGGTWTTTTPVIAAINPSATGLQSFSDPKIGLSTLTALGVQRSFALKLSSDPAGTIPVIVQAPSQQDNAEAARFRTALTGLYKRLSLDMPVIAAPVPFDINVAAAAVKKNITPGVSFIKRLNAVIQLPTGITYTAAEPILPVMAYPDFPDPAYAYLRDISKELLIPNLGLIPNNTISLLVTNGKFIESFMVGLNQEMGRLLMWNEYPCDLRGSYFRQFWDATSFQPPATAAVAEALKDITQIHTWPRASTLGLHNNRVVRDSSVVMVVRGDLLKKYPNTIIYAQKAVVDTLDATNAHGIIKTSGIDENIFNTQFKFPEFHASIDPDLMFFGFDLTEPEAIGVTASNGDHLGWYFVIQQVAGDPEFGLDISFTTDTAASQGDPAPPVTWSNESWTNFNTPPTFLSSDIPPQQNIGMISDAAAHPWAKNAAEMAYILARCPIMVAVHASEMLPGGTTTTTTISPGVTPIIAPVILQSGIAVKTNIDIHKK